MPLHANRRDFLRLALAASAPLAACSAPDFLNRAARAVADGPATTERVLVVVQLTGGNDGLNTVVPYADPAYLKARPTLRIGEGQAIKLVDKLGLHPSLTGFGQLWEAGQLAVVQGVGYPHPNRSHFESMDIWHSARPAEVTHRLGWLGRTLDAQARAANNEAARHIPALHLGGNELPLALIGRQSKVPSIRSLDSFQLREAGGALPATALRELASSPRPGESPLLEYVRRNTLAALDSSERLKTSAASLPAAADYPSFSLAQKLRLIAQLIDSGLHTRIYYVTLDGFDTHAGQAAAHGLLLSELGDSLRAFVQDLQARGQAERVAVMCFSEFGRRVRENASAGTDHGAAAPVFIAGGSIAGGLVGAHPSLTDLDDGDLRSHTDFRQVYATLLEDWLQADSHAVLDGPFAKLPLIKKIG